MRTHYGYIVEDGPLTDIERLIAHYDLVPLPVEGTLYSSTYVSSLSDEGGVPAGTAIVGLYAHVPLSHSLFHRLTSDEVWHFYGGDPLRLVLLHPDGSSSEVIMGSDHDAGQRVQFVVPSGTWQAGHCIEGGRYSLFGCTMAPGFTGAAFEGGTINRLCAEYPERAADIGQLGIPDTNGASLPPGFAQ